MMLCVVEIFFFVNFILFQSVGCSWPWSQSSSDLTLQKLSTGRIRGRHLITSRNISGYVFLGIPYAEPPIGHLRYRAPRPVKPWRGIIEVKEYKNSCLWNSTITSNLPEYTRMSEDCLTVNVFTNANCLRNGGCAVVYMIHGGEYNFDSPMLFPIDFLVDNFTPENRSVIFVSVTYRLGSFGFLNISPKLKSSAIKNVGLLDMIEGLRWVQKEISNLGGDPKRVTLMGHSSGAVNAQQLTVSPLTKGLFHQAIIMSGSLGIPIPPNNGERVSKRFAVATGCAGETFDNENLKEVETVLNCLRKMDAQKLINVQRNIEEDGFMFAGPCVDGHNGVLPQPIDDLLQRIRPIRMMIGTVQKEMQDTAYLLCDDGTVDKKGVFVTCNTAIRLFGYRSQRKPTQLCTIEYIQPSKTAYIFDDPAFFVNAVLYSESIMRAHGKAFLYQFDYGNVGDAFYLGPNLPKYTPEQSPHHTQEFVYIVGIHLGNFTEKDEIIRLKFSQLLIDFINKGDPSPPHMHWSALRLHQLNYFSIDFDEQNNMPGMKYGYHAHEIAFWNQTIRRAGHGRKALKDEALLQSSTTADLVGIPSPDKYCTDARSKNLSTKDNSRGLIKKQFRTRSLELDSSVVAVQPNDTKLSLQNVDVVVWLLMLLSFFSTIIFSATCATFLVERSRIKEYERLD